MSVRLCRALAHARVAPVAPLARTLATRTLACALSPSSSALASTLPAPRPCLPAPSRRFWSPPGAASADIATQPSPDGKGTIPVVLVRDYKKIADQFGAIVDVREPKEVAEGAIPGAVNIPLAQVEQNPNLTQFKGKKVLVYCRAGIRSAKAVAAMQGAGIDAVNLGGGYLAWQGDQ